MESGRFLLAVMLMIAVVVITNILIPPTPPPEPAAMGADSLVAPPVSTAPATAAPAVPDPRVVRSPVTPDSAMMGEPEVATVDSDLLRFLVSDRGGAIVSAELKAFESFAPGTEGQPVQLDPEAGAGLIRYRLRLDDRVVDLGLADFELNAKKVDVAGNGGPKALELRWSDPASSLGVTLTYTFNPDSYVVDINGVVTGATSTPQLLIDLGPTLRSNEAALKEDQAALAFVVDNTETGIHSTSLGRFSERTIESGPLRWVALKNKYFLVAAMQSVERPSPFGGVIAEPATEPFSANLTATLLADADGRFAYRLYVGPQHPERLRALGNELQDVTVFGWKFLQPVLRPLGHAITWALLVIHRALNLGYGWVLILFGFLIRFVLWPLNAKAMRSQLKNMEMQPRIKEIQARFKNDPQRLQQEMLKLYKEEGFNPMGGCLPMLLPLPVLITLFFVFRSTIEFRGVPFLWLPDLSRQDPLYILPVLLGLSMFAQQWLNMKSTKDTPQQMKYMTYIMPVMLTVLFIRFASGLNLYYASMNVASLPQQLQIMKEKRRRAGIVKKKE